MRVLKRSNEYEDVSFDKVLRRISKLSHGINVNYHEIAQKVCSRIYDGVHTDLLDELASNICSSLIVDNPDYDILAARLSISNHHKKTCGRFSETIELLYNNTVNQLVSDEVYSLVIENKDILDTSIDYENDYLLDYFGFKTLEKSYLLGFSGKSVERPQDMWLRVALGIHGNDIYRALETYKLMSTKMFTHATPTLFNFGTKREQGSSCFLLHMEADSVSGEYNTLRECALISKYAGGIGLHIHNVRGNGSIIKGTNGKSTGIVPMLRVYNDAARHINQAGKRNGSFAIYLEPWHSDIFPFLELKKNHGNESERARDLFYALWIPDLFMQRVKEDGVWSLMCPNECPGLSDTYDDAISGDLAFTKLYQKYENEKRYVKQVKAQDIWFKILEAQIETGTPYMLYKDAVNTKTNHKNLGTIKSSNLCVAPETRVLTDNGYKTISDLENKEVNIFNGEEFSNVVVKQTGSNQKLLTVRTSRGQKLRCTPYHKFYVYENTKTRTKKEIIIEARNLKEGMCLINHDLPLITESSEDSMKYPYTHGFFCADGTVLNYESKRCKFVAKLNGRCMRHQNNLSEYNDDSDLCQANSYSKRKCVDLYHEKKILLRHIEYQYANVDEKSNKIRCALPYDIEEKYFVPINQSLDIKLEWLAGYLDGDACVVKHTGGNACSIQVSSIHNDFLLNVQLLLQTIGINSRISLMRKGLSLIHI